MSGQVKFHVLQETYFFAAQFLLSPSFGAGKKGWFTIITLAQRCVDVPYGWGWLESFFEEFFQQVSLQKIGAPYFETLSYSIE